MRDASSHPCAVWQLRVMSDGTRWPMIRSWAPHGGLHTDPWRVADNLRNYRIRQRDARQCAYAFVALCGAVTAAILCAVVSL